MQWEKEIGGEAVSAAITIALEGFYNSARDLPAQSIQDQNSFPFLEVNKILDPVNSSNAI